MFENIEVMQEVLNEIAKESGGNFEDMSYQQKRITVQIMKEYKRQIDKFMVQEYYKIKMWSSLDLKDILLEETEPDLSHLYNNGFSEQLNKLMGI